LEGGTTLKENEKAERGGHPNKMPRSLAGSTAGRIERKEIMGEMPRGGDARKKNYRFMGKKKCSEDECGERGNSLKGKKRRDSHGCKKRGSLGGFCLGNVCWGRRKGNWGLEVRGVYRK